MWPGFTKLIYIYPSSVSAFHFNITILPLHNGHIYAKIMHFRSKKHGRFWQFQGFPLIMHYLKVIKPTVQLKIPFKSDSNNQK